MNDLFLKITNMSIAASWLVAAVIVLRLILKKAPKWVNVLLWGIVAVRLICPFSIESVLSLIPSTETINTTVYQSRPYIQSGVEIFDNRVNDYLGSHYFEGVTVPEESFAIQWTEATLIWMAGMVILLVYMVISCWKVHERVREAVRLRDNIYQSEKVGSPFVLGILKPRIYLSYDMAEQDMQYVTAHEQAHIRRRDHWWKPIGFLLLTLHWFNPIMWLAYILLCRDIELACDEKVIRELGTEQRADYSQALLTCSAGRRLIAACPLAFGEVGVKERVKSVLNYKKPGFWIILAAVAVCVAVAVCFLTNPAGEEAMDWAQGLSVEDVKHIELIVPVEERYRLYTGEELEEIVSLINQSRGRPVNNPEHVGGLSVALYITLKDGTVHLVVNDGAYLSIDGRYFDPGTEWLSDWNDKYANEANAPIPENFYERVAGLTGPLPLEALPPDYSLEEAKRDGCVVMEDGDVTAGQQVWQNFLEAVNRGEKASVRYVTYYTLEDPGRYDPAYYESVKDDYPSMYVHDLTFDGKRYTVRWFEDGEEIVRNYRYMMKYEGVPDSPFAVYESHIRYVLTNDKNVTWEDILHGLASSQLGDYIDHLPVYTDLIYADDPTLSELERVKDALSTYMVRYRIATLDANEITGMLDIEVYERVDGLEETVARLIDLKYVNISIFEGELGFTAPEKMTLDDVIELSKLGMDLTWADVTPYPGEEIGSGLFIWRYRIDDEFFLCVGDGKQSGTPMYAMLYSESTGDTIDIREGDVEAFIAAHQ